MQYSPPRCRCGQDDPGAFSPSKRKAGTACRACSSARLMEWRKTAPRHREYQRERRTANAKLIDDYKLARGCTDCGYSAHACALDLHHLNAETKKHNVGHLRNGGWSAETIAAELEKCIVLCANCHRVHTYAQGE